MNWLSKSQKLIIRSELKLIAITFYIIIIFKKSSFVWAIFEFIHKAIICWELIKLSEQCYLFELMIYKKIFQLFFIKNQMLYLWFVIISSHTYKSLALEKYLNFKGND